MDYKPQINDMTEKSLKQLYIQEISDLIVKYFSRRDTYVDKNLFNVSVVCCDKYEKNFKACVICQICGSSIKIFGEKSKKGKYKWVISNFMKHYMFHLNRQRNDDTCGGDYFEKLKDKCDNNSNSELYVLSGNEDIQQKSSSDGRKSSLLPSTANVQSLNDISQNLNKKYKQKNQNFCELDKNHRTKYVFQRNSFTSPSATLQNSSLIQKSPIDDYIEPRELCSANYSCKKNDNKLTSFDDLNIFVDFINVELGKLDKNSLEVAKMKISKILYEASLGFYKNEEESESNEYFENASAIVDESISISDTEMSSNSNSRRKRKRSDDKENISSVNKNDNNKVLQDTNLIINDENNAEPESRRIYKKKRIKTKDLISLVYDTLNIEKNNEIKLTSGMETFGLYISNELKKMDNITLAKTKLNICRILFEASVGNYKNLNYLGSVLNDNNNLEEITNQRQQKNHQKEQQLNEINNVYGVLNVGFQEESNGNIELKEEIIDSSYNL